MPSADPPAGLAILTACSVCRHPLASAINERLRKGESGERVSAWLGDIGREQYVSPPTLRKHRDQHLTDDHERARAEAADHLRRQSKTIKGKPGDLAGLVRDNVFLRVEGGELDPTLSEGLRAQEMLDRRSEKGADRDVAIAIAGLLSGAVQPVAVSKLDAPALPPPPGASEGEWAALVAEREADEATFRVLLDPTDDPLRPVEAARNR